MIDLSAVAGSLLACLSLLAIERVAVSWLRRRLGLCIAVTGTRGKPSVTRLIAAGLREDGRQVLPRTTGPRRSCLPDPPPGVRA